MNIVNPDLMNDCGVYKIVNMINNKIYIGSTSMNFQKRYNHHICQLRNNKHKNNHLQKSFNKYKEDNFSFEIIEVCLKENCLEREEYWMNFLSTDYNINKIASGGNQFSDDIIKKRSNSIRETGKNNSDRYKNWKIGNLNNSELTEKELNLFNQWNSYIPWNKDRTYKSTNHLKVSHKKSNKLEKAYQNLKILWRNKNPKILVFDINNNFIKEYSNARDLQDLSNSENFELSKYMLLKNKSGRNGYYPHYLTASNISKCARGLNNQYKGLIFKFK